LTWFGRDAAASQYAAHLLLRAIIERLLRDHGRLGGAVEGGRHDKMLHRTIRIAE
jgi:hypothetical protein